MTNRRTDEVHTCHSLMNRFWILLLAATLCGCNLSEAPDSGKPEVRFIVLDRTGSPSVDGADHTCVRDLRTGLIWERKSDDEGLHDWRHTYSWYDPDEAHHELDYRGTPDGGSCRGSQCDTWSVVNAVNEERLCGFDDWRMPSRDEVFSLAQLRMGSAPPIIETEFFPLTQSAEYWTSNDYSFQPDSAWTFSHEHSLDRVDWKKTPKYVRLVRGQALDLTQMKE